MRSYFCAFLLFFLIDSIAFGQAIISGNYSGAGPNVDDAAIGFTYSVKITYDKETNSHRYEGTVFKEAGKQSFYLILCDDAVTQTWQEIGSAQSTDWGIKTIQKNSTSLLSKVGQRVRWAVIYSNMPVLKTGDVVMPKPTDNKNKTFSKTIRNLLNATVHYVAFQGGKVLGDMTLEAGQTGTMNFELTSDSPVEIYANVSGKKMNPGGWLEDSENDNGDPWLLDSISPSTVPDGQTSEGESSKSTDPLQNMSSIASQGGPNYVSSVLNAAPNFKQSANGSALNDRVYQDGVSVLHVDMGEILKAMNKLASKPTTGGGGAAGGSVDLTPVTSRLDKLVNDSKANTEAFKKENDEGFSSLFTKDKRTQAEADVKEYPKKAQEKLDAAMAGVQSAISDMGFSDVPSGGDYGEGTGLPESEINIQLSSSEEVVFRPFDFDNNTFGGWSFLKSCRVVILWAMGFWTGSILIRKVKELVFFIGPISPVGQTFGVENYVPGVPQAKNWTSAAIWSVAILSSLVAFVLYLNGGFSSVSGQSGLTSFNSGGSVLSTLGVAYTFIDSWFPIAAFITYRVMQVGADVLATTTYLAMIHITKFLHI